MSDSPVEQYDHEEATTYDPFGNDVQQAILITNMKIYDALMALLTVADEKMAEDLDALHTQGIVLGQGPTFLQFSQRDSDNASDSVPADSDE